VIAFPPLQGLRWPTDADARRGSGMAGRCLTMAVRILDTPLAGVGPDRWCVDGVAPAWERLDDGFDDAPMAAPTLRRAGRWPDGRDGGGAVFADRTVLLGREEGGTRFWCPFPFVQEDAGVWDDAAAMEANLAAAHRAMQTMPPLAYGPDHVTYDATRYHAPWAAWQRGERGHPTARMALHLALLWSAQALPHPAWDTAEATAQSAFPQTDGTWGPASVALRAAGMQAHALDAWQRLTAAWVARAYAAHDSLPGIAWHPRLGIYAQQLVAVTTSAPYAHGLRGHERMAWERDGVAHLYHAWAKDHPDAFATV